MSSDFSLQGDVERFGFKQVMYSRLEGGFLAAVSLLNALVPKRALLSYMRKATIKLVVLPHRESLAETLRDFLRILTILSVE